MRTTLYASEDIARIVAGVGLNRLMDETIDAIGAACRDAAAGQFHVPVRAGFEYDTPRTGLVEWMPAMHLGERIVIKVVGYHPHNPVVSAAPTILSSVLVLDPASGHLSSVLDGTFLTALRTGAASALATRHLAHPDATRLGLVGAGAQAVTQLHALSRVLPLTGVRVFDVDPATAAGFAARVAPLALDGLTIETTTLAGVVDGAHVLCTATSVDLGAGPVVSDEGLHPAVHVNAVGSDFPGKTELPLALLERALVVPDFRAQAVREGECQQLADAAIGPDLCELVNAPDAFAHHRNGPTVFDSTGFALEDYAVAVLLTRYGESLGCGQSVALESLGADPKNPYGFLDALAAAPAARRAAT